MIEFNEINWVEALKLLAVMMLVMTGGLVLI